LKILNLDPADLSPNPWNPNIVDPINQGKLKESLLVDGIQKPILVRTLKDGKVQIIDGQHRVAAAIEIGLKTIPCADVGDIPDGKAKKITLIANNRYGEDDADLMAALLGDEDLCDMKELLATLPYEESQLESYFEHINLNDELADVDDLDDDLDLGIEQNSAPRTHQVLRFKVSMEDSVQLGELITSTRHEQGFTGSDDLTNSGDALVYILLNSGKLVGDSE